MALLPLPGEVASDASFSSLIPSPGSGTFCSTKMLQARDVYLTNIYYFQSETLPKCDSDGPCLLALSIWDCWWQTPIGAASASFWVNYTHMLVMRAIH